jgi:hypothetical protein
MGRRASAPPGCAGLFIVLLPFWWAYDKCTGGDGKRAQEAVQAEIQATNERAAYAAADRQRAQADAVRKMAEEQQKAAARATKKTQLAAMQPYQRVQLVQQCAKGDCPEGTPDAALVIEAAKSGGERRQLQALSDRIEKAQERLSAPLRCCDGSDSPSCTCGNPHRGCCSHHSGVCGCSADQ